MARSAAVKASVIGFRLAPWSGPPGLLCPHFRKTRTLRARRPYRILLRMPILLPVLLFAAALNPYDLVIRNGRIIDGTGSPWYAGDVAIRAGKIAAIGNLGAVPARRSIDARGMVVAPGFIDMLGQSEITILVNQHLPSKIFQGITTEITGEGNSVAPLNDAIAKADHVTYEHYGVQPDWRTFREYFARLRKQGMGINLASYVGATSVRRMVLGDDNRAPTAAELERMKALVREAMSDVAVGLSTSLQYAPAPYARTEELIALAAEASKFGGSYASHIRDEGAGIMAALDEAFRIGREAKFRLKSGTSRRRASPTGDECRRSWRISRKPANRGWTWLPTPTPIPPPSIRFRRSFRRGRTMAGTRN